jgi:hypothetical protein
MVLLSGVLRSVAGAAQDRGRVRAMICNSAHTLPAFIGYHALFSQPSSHPSRPDPP